jgi:hypothetical protein
VRKRTLVGHCAQPKQNRSGSVFTQNMQEREAST